METNTKAIQEYVKTCSQHLFTYGENENQKFFKVFYNEKTDELVKITLDSKFNLLQKTTLDIQRYIDSNREYLPSTPKLAKHLADTYIYWHIFGSLKNYDYSVQKEVASYKAIRHFNYKEKTNIRELFKDILSNNETLAA